MNIHKPRSLTTVTAQVNKSATWQNGKWKLEKRAAILWTCPHSFYLVKSIQCKRHVQWASQWDCKIYMVWTHHRKNQTLENLMRPTLLAARYICSTAYTEGKKEWQNSKEFRSILPPGINSIIPTRKKITPLIISSEWWWAISSAIPARMDTVHVYQQWQG